MSSFREMLATGRMFAKKVVLSLEEKIDRATPECVDNYRLKSTKKSARHHHSKIARQSRTQIRGFNDEI